MAAPPSPARRKSRLLRDGDVLADDVIVVRAAPVDPRRAIRNIVDDAHDSGSTYVVAHDAGLEILHGISVFARRPGVRTAELMVRFRLSPSILEASAGALRGGGFELWATGTNPDHYDVQLVPGRIEAVDPQATVRELGAAAAGFLWVAGGLQPNPGYAGGGVEQPEDDTP